jgi:excisionase family DNA binding protein
MDEQKNVAAVLTTTDVAERWKVTRQTVTSLYRRGELRGFKAGSNLRFRLEDVEAFEQATMSEGTRASDAA